MRPAWSRDWSLPQKKKKGEEKRGGGGDKGGGGRGRGGRGGGDSSSLMNIRLEAEVKIQAGYISNTSRRYGWEAEREP